MRTAILDTETTGLNPRTDRIIAIGAKIYDTSGDEDNNYYEFVNEEDEKAMLKSFWLFIDEWKIDKIAGFNLDFDWTFIKLRTVLVHKIKGFDVKHFEDRRNRIDIRLLLDGYNRYQKGTKLHDYLVMAGIPNGDEWKGSDVPKFFAEGKIEPILSHLEKDVHSTFELYKICKECGLI